MMNALFMKHWVENFFHFSKYQTNFRKEILAGLTTFTAMAYILVVNPAMLKETGMDLGALITATALAAAIMSAAMALATNYPICLAPGMGLNAFFTYTVCLGMGVPWQAALGIVFYSGLIFLILTWTGLRQKIIDSIPFEFKAGMSCGIGLFIAFIGLQNGGLIVKDDVTLVKLGDMSLPSSLMVLFGIILTGALVWRKVRGAIIIPVIVLTIIGIFIPAVGGQGMITQTPTQIVSLPSSLSPTFLQLDLTYLWKHFAHVFPVLVALLFIDIFDMMGTMIGVCHRAGFLNKDGKLPKMERAMAVDAFAAMTGSVLGTSSVVTYIESAAGVEEGGRTGFTSIVVAVCFVLALFLTPLIKIVPLVATAPALVIVGVFMMQDVVDLDLRDFTVAVPAFIVMITMPLTFSINEGLGLGFITYAGMKLGTGRWKEAPIAAYVLALLFLIHYITR
ncbi:MAG: NCS2 family permease [Verrucomicrobiota bacterium]